MTRAPGTLFQKRAVDVHRVTDMLIRAEQTHRNNAWAAIAGGGMLCLVSVFLLTVLYELLPTPSIGGFKFTYIVVGIVGLPLLFWLAYKLQGSLLEATVPGSDLLQTRIVGRRVIPILFVAEIANIGPRLVLWGIAQVRGRSAFGTMSHDRLAAALVTLAEADGGISPAKLILPGESADQLEPLLGVLLYHELADLSKNADRVWITTEAKRKLAMV
jgi:hypothetical protein